MPYLNSRPFNATKYRVKKNTFIGWELYFKKKKNLNKIMFISK